MKKSGTDGEPSERHSGGAGIVEAGGEGPSKARDSKPYLLPAVIWFLDHPQAVAQAFPNGDVARKIVVLCLDSLEIPCSGKREREKRRMR